MWCGVRKGESSEGIDNRVLKGGKLATRRPCEGSSAKFEDKGMYEGDIQMECVAKISEWPG